MMQMKKSPTGVMYLRSVATVLKLLGYMCLTDAEHTDAQREELANITGEGKYERLLGDRDEQVVTDFAANMIVCITKRVKGRHLETL